MRLFTAIDIPDAIRDEIDSLIQALRPTARLRWSPAANLHITTKFIGEATAGQLPAIEDALRLVPVSGPIPIAIRGIGWLPHEKAPRLIYLQVQAPPALRELHTATDAILAPLGIPPETKLFRPHLTVARIPPDAAIGNLRQALTALPSVDFGSFEAAEFGLYESRLQPRGSVYTRLSAYPL